MDAGKVYILWHMGIPVGDGVLGQTVKEIWKKLRDCHRDALRRQAKKRSSQGDIKMKAWTYQKQMEFLLPYMKSKTASGNIDINQEDVDLEYDLHCELESSSPLLEGGNYEGIGKEIESTQKPAQQPTTNSSKSYKKIATKKRRIDQLLLKTLKERAIRRNQKDEERKRLSYEEEQKKDSLYQFFISMYNCTKKLPKISQLRIKKKLFDAVHLEEEKFALDETSTQSLTGHAV